MSEGTFSQEQASQVFVNVTMFLKYRTKDGKFNSIVSRVKAIVLGYM